MEKNYSLMGLKNGWLTLTLAICFCMVSMKPGYAATNYSTSPYNFIQNKGQLKTTNGKEASEVLYYSERGNLRVFLQKDKISYVLNTQEKGKSSQGSPMPKFVNDVADNRVQMHRVDLTFINANPFPEIVTEGPASDVLSFYNKKSKKGETVDHYSKIIYKDLYPNIDLVYHFGENDNFKYDFIVHPGGNPNDIVINYNGSDKLEVNGEGALQINTTLGKIMEATPYTYLLQSKKEIPAQFNVNDNQLTFLIEDYDSAETLVIDPELAWSTYLGGQAVDNGFTITTDAAGNFYVAGSTLSSTFPATTGAFQSALNGVLNTDVVLSKFDKDGNLLWSTYYGGTEDDRAWGIAADAAGNIFLTGTTESPDFPTTAGALQTATLGISDAFILKFDTNGNRLYASFFGGEGNDFGYGVATDATGNVYITGYTSSVVGFPIVAASQPAPAAGDEVFLSKMDNSGNLLWSTYFGGNSSDNSFSVAVDSTGNPYITGRTTSSNLPAAINASNTGDEIFITKFTSAGAPMWSKYLGGTDNEVANGIAVDGAGAAYITGYTSSTNFPVTAGYFPMTYGGGLFDAFVGKVDASGNTEWLSYYGGTGRDIGNEVTIDVYGKVNIVGLTESANLVVSGDAYQPTQASQTDAFILRLTSDGALDWGTYFGGSDDDYGYDIAYNTSKALYHIVGSTRSMNLPVKNAEQPNKAGGVDDIDMFIATFCGDVVNNSIAINTGDTLEICPGDALASIIGTVPTGAGTDFTYQYQSSLDNITWSDIAGATGKDYTPATVAQTTYFRRMVIYGGPCSEASNTVVIIVNPLPAVDFTAANGCSGSPVIFTNTTTVNGGTMASVSWNFGDGGTSTDVSPSYTYATTGSYNVTLIVTTDNGCVDSLTKTITIDTAPDAEFTAEAGCPGTSTVFLNVSTGTVASWLWEFGDGSTSTAFDTSHVYATSGSYMVKLTAITANGCMNTDSASITVAPAPAASFNYVAGTTCLGDSTQFVNTSTITSGTIASTVWAFGDGGTSTLPTPKHLYAAAGVYPVTLIVTSDNGCSDTITMNVTIGTAPEADFTYAGQCMNSNTSFTSNSSADAVSFTWDFGDGTFGAGQTATNLYGAAGSYTVTLMVENATGCQDSITKTIVIDTAPDAEFTSDVTSGCPGTSISFTDNSTITTGTITSWTYNFGDGNTSTDQNPSNVFASAGSYVVTLTTTSSNGCSNTDSISITIFNTPVAEFTTASCTDKVVEFTDASTVAGSTIASWSWNFGDGNTASSQNPSHTYAATGTYNVTLTVVSAQGCTATVTKPVVVSPAAVADFINTTPACSGNEINFTDNSTVSTGTIVSWSWNFGDGATSADQNPSHTYANAGTYTVTLTITTSTGCTKTVSKQVTIESSPVAEFTSTGTCGSMNTSFADNSTGTITGWNWNFGDGSTSGSQNPSHTYASQGAYTVTLIVTSSNGCTDTVVKTININAAPVADFTTSAVCAGSVTSFTDISTVSGGTIASRSWNFGDGGTSTAQNPTHTYASTGTFTVSLTVVSNAGCSTTVTKTVTVNAMPVAGFASPDGCAKSEIAFKDNSQAGFGTVSTWSWSFGNGTTSSAQHPVATYTEAGSYTAQLIVTTADGCTDTVTGLVNINPVPVVNAGEDKLIIKGKSIQLNATSNVEGTFAWAPEVGLSELNIPNPMAKPSDNITYVVTVTTAAGCVGSDDITISVEKPLVIPTAFTPNNDGVNDQFEIQNIDMYPNAMVKVYNRWGSELFSSSDPNERWDGRNRNEDMPMGAYYFVIDLKDGSEPIKGTISIIK